MVLPLATIVLTCESQSVCEGVKGERQEGHQGALEE